MAQPAYCEPRQAMAGWSVHTCTPGRRRPSNSTDVKLSRPALPMQISARRRPASSPPGASMPQAMSRAPFPSVEATTPRATASATMASAIAAARSLSRSEPPSTLASGGMRFPYENLPLPGNRSVARVALIGPVLLFIGDAEPERRQVPCIYAQESGVVRAGIRERRQESNRRQRDDRTPGDPGAGPKLGPAAQENGSALHLQAGEVPHLAAHRDEPSSHPHSDFEARRALDEDHPALIPERLPR